MKIRCLSAILVAFCAAGLAAMGNDAPPRQDLFYYGNARITDLFSGRANTQKILLEKVVDPQAGMLIEMACFQEHGKVPRSSPVYMKVSGSSVTISDTLTADKPGILTGTGRLHGKNWDWNYLEFSMSYSRVKIEDVNFVVKDKLIARKKIFMSDGTPVQLWETELTLIKPEDYQERYKSMGCK